MIFTFQCGLEYGNGKIKQNRAFAQCIAVSSKFEL